MGAKSTLEPEPGGGNAMPGLKEPAAKKAPAMEVATATALAPPPVQAAPAV